jgi:hypothetical protein
MSNKEQIKGNSPSNKPDVKPDTKPDVKPDIKPDVKPDVKPGKVFFEKEKQEINGKQVMVGKWSDEFSNSKESKSEKGNKPKKADAVEFEEGTVLLIDEDVEVASITGDVKMFTIRKGTLKVNGKKLA